MQEKIKMRRFFTDASVDPFDSISWVRRTAEIKSMTGKVTFRQENVEVPESWSQLATNVVASKYFYGDVTGQLGFREDSVKQLALRVSTTIADKAGAMGIFDSFEDLKAFENELRHMIINQIGAFNSPVWFNVGLHQKYGVKASNEDDYIYAYKDGRVVKVDPYEHPQASACFIIEVDDSIDSIWNSVSESARLFKYGSGVGADWSKLRSSKEMLSGGGRPSGPVSFMRVQDVTGGTIKSGGKTRRAAIMQTLKVTHPDIEEFVRAKQEEERKAWALIEQGYDGSFNGPAYGSVAFQNVNQSVRITDGFMRAYMDDADFPLSDVDGNQIGYVRALDLMDLIAEGTYICGDPGVQYEDTIQNWHTCSDTEPIQSSNPCSEFMFLNNTACNLASINLRKFYNAGVFDKEGFAHACEVFFIAQEVLVEMAGYPSEAIALRSYQYRPLGLGFANLGALLMTMGLPYDSYEGRNVAGGISAIMTGQAYLTSVKLARAIGAFEMYANNKGSFMEVMRSHRDEAYELMKEVGHGRNEDVVQYAVDIWDDVVDLGSEFGFRNAQATVLAPTGTISFMMDCDTTGIEPDIALVKYKLLAGQGEGALKIVNNSVGDALKALGYSEEDIVMIIAHIHEHDTIEGCDLVYEGHLPVFDCAFKPHNGTRFLHWKAHIRMMAACQPFISGAISKTVNMPESTTVEEIKEAYIMGWEQDLKAVAIYRENSKRSQPLSTSLGGNTRNATKETQTVEVEKIVYKPAERKRLPNTRPSLTHKVEIQGVDTYITAGLYDNGQPGEIFIVCSKQGSTLSGIMDAFASSISISLQYGVPLEVLVNKFKHTAFEPAGFTRNKDIPTAKSIIDYIFKWLESEFIFKPGIDAMVIEAAVAEAEHSGDGHHDNTPVLVIPYAGPACSNCGGITQLSGSCHVCSSCGTTTGCG